MLGEFTEFIVTLPRNTRTGAGERLGPQAHEVGAAALRELAGLFIHDGALALVILAVVVLTVMVATLLPEVPLVAGHLAGWLSHCASFERSKS